MTQGRRAKELKYSNKGHLSRAQFYFSLFKLCTFPTFLFPHLFLLNVLFPSFIYILLPLGPFSPSFPTFSPDCFPHSISHYCLLSQIFSFFPSPFHLLAIFSFFFSLFLSSLLFLYFGFGLFRLLALPSLLFYQPKKLRLFITKLFHDYIVVTSSFLPGLSLQTMFH